MNNFIKNRGWQYVYSHLHTLASSHFLLCSSVSQIEHAPLGLFFPSKGYFFFPVQQLKTHKGQKDKICTATCQSMWTSSNWHSILTSHLAELKISQGSDKSKLKFVFRLPQHALRFLLNLCNSIHRYVTAQNSFVVVMRKTSLSGC